MSIIIPKAGLRKQQELRVGNIVPLRGRYVLLFMMKVIEL